MSGIKKKKSLKLTPASPQILNIDKLERGSPSKLKLTFDGSPEKPTPIKHDTLLKLEIEQLKKKLDNEDYSDIISKP